MRSTRRGGGGGGEGIVGGSGGDAAGAVSEMDPWKDDRCRDFIVLNTIQRLRGYHLPAGAPAPAVEAVNLVRSRNLVLLPRAQPDFRPCQGEQKPTRAERRAARRQQRRQQQQQQKDGEGKEGAEVDRRRGSSSTTATDSSFSSSSSDDDDDNSDSSSSGGGRSPPTDSPLITGAVGEAEGGQQVPPPHTPQQRHGRSPSRASPAACAVDRARAFFFGAQAFTSSTSPRRFVSTPHVPLTPSPAYSSARHPRTAERRQPDGGEEGRSAGQDGTGPAYRSLLGDLNDSHAAEEGAAQRSGATAVDNDGEATRSPPAVAAPAAAAEAADSPALPPPPPLSLLVGVSPQPKQPWRLDGGGDADADADEAPGGAALVSSCEAAEVLTGHYQSLLTRGVVLDKLNHKELGFAWWVIGKNMCVAALDETARPQRREALLITLRNLYYSLLNEEAAAAAKRTAAAAAEEEQQQQQQQQKQQPVEEEERREAEAPPVVEKAATGDDAGTAGAAPTGGRTRRAALERAKAVLALAGAGAVAADGEGVARPRQHAAKRPRAEGGEAGNDAVAEEGRAGDSPEPARAEAEADDRAAAEAPPGADAGDAELQKDVLPGRGRTHGQQGKAAARRKAIEATWRSMRSSNRRGGSLATNEEGSNLQPPADGTTAAEAEAEEAAPAPAEEKATATTATTAATAAALEKEEGAGAGEKETGGVAQRRSPPAASRAAKTKPTKAQGKAVSAAVSPSREPSLPSSGTAAPPQQPKRRPARAAAAKAAADAGKRKDGEAADSVAPDPAPTAPAPAPVPATRESTPPTEAEAVAAPTEEELAAAAAEAHRRAVTALALEPTPLQRLVEGRIGRRMSVGAAAAVALAKGHPPGRRPPPLPAQSSYAFLLASPANVPAAATGSRKRRRPNAPTAAVWETVLAPAAGPQEGPGPGDTAAHGGRVSSSPVERRGRKKAAPQSDLDADGDVDAALMVGRLRHDQTPLEESVTRRIAEEGEEGGEGVGTPSVTADGGDGRDAQRAAKPSGEAPVVVKVEAVDSEDVEEEGDAKPDWAARAALAEERQAALMATPFTDLPYALQCLLVWEAADLLEGQRRRVAHRQHRRQREGGILRPRGPVTRRMAALAAKGELPSTSSGSSAASSSNDDDSVTESGSSNTASSDDDDDEDEEEDEEDEEVASPGHRAGYGGGPLPRQFYDYWAAYRRI